MSPAELMRHFEALARANQDILRDLQAGLPLEALEASFLRRESHLEALKKAPNAGDPAWQDEALRGRLGEVQAQAARAETGIAEILAQLVSSNEKVAQYLPKMSQKHSGTRWDSLG